MAHAIAEGLRRRGAEVTTTVDAGLLGASDTAHLSYAHSGQQVFFTEDEDLLAIAAGGFVHSGIVYCRQGSRSIGDIVRALELIWEIYEPDEMVGRIEFI